MCVASPKPLFWHSGSRYSGARCRWRGFGQRVCGTWRRFGELVCFHPVGHRALEEKRRQDHECDHSVFHDLSFPDGEAVISRMTWSNLFLYLLCKHGEVCLFNMAHWASGPPSFGKHPSNRKTGRIATPLPRGVLGPHPAINPPSMGRMLPVVQRDSSDAK